MIKTCSKLRLDGVQEKVHTAAGLGCPTVHIMKELALGQFSEDNLRGLGG